MRDAICNTSPIQYLHQIGFLHLLADFYACTLIPPAVMDELERGRAIGIDLPETRTLPWVKIQAPAGSDKAPAAADLGAGEKEVPALGMQVPGAVAVLQHAGEVRPETR